VKLTIHLNLGLRLGRRGAILPFPKTSSWRGALVKHRENFTFYLMVIRRYISSPEACNCVNVNEVYLRRHNNILNLL